MRRVSVACRVVAFVAVFSLSAAGQQPSQRVLEPEHSQAELTLADAARTNNYPLFDSLYTEAGEEAPAFAELHRFWKWSLEDRIGGFYGKEMYGQFARDYSGYAEYIADHAIVDSNGNVFYPSSETRAFLLQQAVKGNVPRPHPVKVAKAKAKAKPVVARVAPPAAAPKPAAVVKPAPPAVVAAPVPAVVPTPSVASQPLAAAAAPPAVVERREARRSMEPQPAERNRFAPAIALVIAGLIGVGVLTLMLRTPSEEIPQPKEEEPAEPYRIIPLERKPKKTA